MLTDISFLIIINVFNFVNPFNGSKLRGQSQKFKFFKFINLSKTSIG
jgi:hypothetical protein